MEEWLTSKQVQEMLQVDRTTIYRMLNDGRLNGSKVGGQWRFARREVEGLLTNNPASPPPSQAEDDVLPISYIQGMQDVFAEMAQVGSVTTHLDGEPMTEVSNSCPFCQAILNSPSGRQACIESWRKLAETPTDTPQFFTCHAGFKYARASIKVDGEPIAMLIAGQFYDKPPTTDMLDRYTRTLADKHNLDYAALRQAAAENHLLAKHTLTHIEAWLTKISAMFEKIGQERAALRDRLRRIADLSSLVG